MMIQRSMLHKWQNPSEMEWSYMAVAMTECVPVQTKNNGTLGTVMPDS